MFILIDIVHYGITTTTTSTNNNTVVPSQEELEGTGELSSL